MYKNNLILKSIFDALQNEDVIYGGTCYLKDGDIFTKGNHLVIYTYYPEDIIDILDKYFEDVSNKDETGLSFYSIFNYQFIIHFSNCEKHLIVTITNEIPPADIIPEEVNYHGFIIQRYNMKYVAKTVIDEVVNQQNFFLPIYERRLFFDMGASRKIRFTELQGDCSKQEEELTKCFLKWMFIDMTPQPPNDYETLLARNFVQYTPPEMVPKDIKPLKDTKRDEVAIQIMETIASHFQPNEYAFGGTYLPPIWKGHCLTINAPVGIDTSRMLQEVENILSNYSVKVTKVAGLICVDFPITDEYLEIQFLQLDHFENFPIAEYTFKNNIPVTCIEAGFRAVHTLNRLLILEHDITKDELIYMIAYTDTSNYYDEEVLNNYIVDLGISPMQILTLVMKLLKDFDINYDELPGRSNLDYFIMDLFGVGQEYEDSFPYGRKTRPY